jgi:hypothetical protein
MKRIKRALRYSIVSFGASVEEEIEMLSFHFVAWMENDLKFV